MIFHFFPVKLLFLKGTEGATHSTSESAEKCKQMKRFHTPYYTITIGKNDLLVDNYRSRSPGLLYRIYFVISTRRIKDRFS